MIRQLNIEIYKTQSQIIIFYYYFHICVFIIYLPIEQSEDFTEMSSIAISPLLPSPITPSNTT